ncbi:MAG: sodium:solute symporter family protein [Gammaproteobacteria bacterium]|nr:sodium:solute symporter family protein [Gammaproteobacteria bacterium]NVK88608.1 sodium:solute symporter family protein [Gammaproteobacteria bacterium]
MDSVAISAELALSILVIFGVIWIAFGWWLGRNNRTIDDFMLAGRNVGFAFASATAMATWITSNTTLVAPQLTYQFGIWGMIGYSLAALGLILFAPMAKRIKALMPHGYTCGDFIRKRYGFGAWIVFLIVSLCYAFGWLVSLGMAGGILLSSLSGLEYFWGMSAILVICIAYTLLGGLKAVIATDFVQTIIILAGVVLIAWIGISDIGLETIYTSVNEKSPQLLDLLFPAAIMFLFNNIFFGIGEIFHSNVWWSRAFAFKKDVGQKAFLTSGLLWLPIPIVTGFIALAAFSLDVYPASADMIGPLIAAQILGKVGAVFVFIVVFSALASSLDSLLAATSDLLTKDIYKGLVRKQATDLELFRFSKMAILIIGLVTWVLCIPKLTTLGSLLNFTGAFVASTIFPIVFGLYFKRLNGVAAALAMAIGTLCGLVGYFTIGFYVAALIACAVSLIICLVGMALVNQRYSWQQLQSED